MLFDPAVEEEVFWGAPEAGTNWVGVDPAACTFSTWTDGKLDTVGDAGAFSVGVSLTLFVDVTVIDDIVCVDI